MTGVLVRRLALTLVFTAGIVSIMATSQMYEYEFRSYNIVTPHYRCPGTDVTADLTMTKPAPVTVQAGKFERRVDAGETRLVLPAEIFDTGDPFTDVAMNIHAYDARDAGDRVWTPLLPTVYARQVSGNFQKDEIFELSIKAGEDLDRRITVLGFTFIPTRYSVHAPPPGSRWRLLQDSGPGLRLTPENDYTATLEKPVSAAGIWRFRLEYLPQDYVHANRIEGCNDCDFVPVDLLIRCAQ